MRHLTMTAAILMLLSFAHCKTKQKAAETPAPPAPLPTASGKTESQWQIEIAQTRWPNTIVEELKEGQAIFTTKCTRCHKNNKVEEFSEKKWLHEIDDMSPKAKLTPEEKLKLTKYLLSSREAKEKLKGY